MSRTVQLITLRGDQLRIVPTFAALEKMEAATGKGAVQLLQEFSSGRYRLSDLASIVFVAAQPMGDRHPNWWKREDVGQSIVDEGLNTVLIAVMSALTDAVTAKPSVQLPTKLEDDVPKL